jgi:microcin C transport system permease protein
MAAYILRRLALMIPTLFGIMVISFVIVQFAPGGPVEQAIARMSGSAVGVSERLTGSEAGDFAGQAQPAQGERSAYRGSRGLSPELIARIEAQFGFDKPPLERFVTMIGNYLRFDFGRSYYRDISVIELIAEKMPVSISLGLWMTLIGYGISIPLGIRKAVRDGSRFDVWTSTVVVIGYAVPGFLVAILLIVLFAGGSFWSIFPLRGLTSPGWEAMPWYRQILDYFWHMTLPLITLLLSAFATTTLLTKNSFIDEIKKQEGRDLTRFDLDFDLPDHFLPEFPPPMFLITRPDLGDVSKGQVVTIDNFHELFNGILNPKQLEGLRLLVTPFPQQQFNQTDDRRTVRPSRGVACFDCHVNGHTNAATHLVGGKLAQEFRQRIDKT